MIIYEPRQRKRRFNDENVYMSEDSDSDSDSGGYLWRQQLYPSRLVQFFCPFPGSQKTKGRGRKHKNNDDDKTYVLDEFAFSRADYFRVEKYLSIFGWGRWKEIMASCNFKRDVAEHEIINLSRTVVS